MNGKVKWFDDKKGFGFIIKDGAAEGDQCSEFFVHYEAIICTGRRTLMAGDLVSFDEGSKNGKLRAVNVRVIGRAPATPPPSQNSRDLAIVERWVDEWERATGNNRETHLVHDFTVWLRTEGAI